jgi:pimeloyl-ACP methyl ester carboxylesterase
MALPPGSEGRDVTTRGARVRVFDNGASVPANARTLVFAHGFLSSAFAWGPMLARLGERYRTVAVELPGFGESEKPSPDKYRYDFEAFAETLLDVTAALGLSRVCAVGHGLGASAALALAARHPSVVERLVLIDPIVYQAEFGPWASLALVPFVGRIAFKQLYNKSVFTALADRYAAHSAKPEAALARAFEQFTTPQGREAAYATLKGMRDTRSLVAVLPRIQVPALIVWGQDDTVVPATHGRKLARELMRARLMILPAGHSPHEETPDAVVAALEDALGAQSIRPTRRSRP